MGASRRLVDSSTCPIFRGDPVGILGSWWLVIWYADARGIDRCRTRASEPGVLRTPANYSVRPTGRLGRDLAGTRASCRRATTARPGAGRGAFQLGEPTGVGDHPRRSGVLHP